MATEAQIEANRRNALKSTGPRTEEGKRASRANAYKDGVTGAGVVMRDVDREAIETRMAAWDHHPAAATMRGEALIETMAVESIRVERCHALSFRLIGDFVDRAETSWDEDRLAEAHGLLGKIGKNPAEIRNQLLGTCHGCIAMRDYWKILGAALDRDGGWDDAMRGVALHLIGHPDSMRNGPSDLDVVGGSADEVRDHRKAIVADTLARLDARIVALKPADDRRRLAARASIGAEMSASYQRIFRQESTCSRRFDRALAELTAPPAEEEPAPVELPAPPVVREPNPRVPRPSAPPAPSPTYRPTSAEPVNRHARRRQAAESRRRAKTKPIA